MLSFLKNFVLNFIMLAIPLLSANLIFYLLLH